MMQFPAAANEYASDPHVVRTHSGDDRVWIAVLEEVRRPWGDGFRSDIVVVEGPEWTDVRSDLVVEAARSASGLSVVFIADELTMRGPDHPLLAATCIRRDDYADFPEEYEAEFEFGPWFRTVPTEVQAIHVNLALANMDFVEFSQVAHESPDRIFRGFGECGG